MRKEKLSLKRSRLRKREIKRKREFKRVREIGRSKEQKFSILKNYHFRTICSLETNIHNM